MRDIKLRAWDKEKEEWAGADYWYEGVGLNFNVTPPSALTMSGKETHVLMQYTGLKDKNGVEIYEGDIVKELWESINGVESTFHMRVFKDNTGAWRVRYPNYTLGNVIAIRKRIEVIGNIYENPELLEVD